jgi:hypothetical protein
MRLTTVLSLLAGASAAVISECQGGFGPHEAHIYYYDNPDCSGDFVDQWFLNEFGNAYNPSTPYRGSDGCYDLSYMGDRQAYQSYSIVNRASIDCE